ncbi:MAG: endonuclease/exonuclease/phosphatase family protein [Pseudomonadota bacterium]
MLLRDMMRGEDAQIAATLRVLAAADADIVALQGIDWDADHRALAWLAEMSDYPHVFAGPPNAGLMTKLDLDGDRRTGRASDAQGWGRFYGDGAMALLSRFPIVAADVQDFTTLLWRDVPDAVLPEVDGAPFPSEAAQEIQRLSNVAHWAVPIDLPDGRRLTVLNFHAAPPVFDGPEDRNDLRNGDEIRLWTLFLDRGFGTPVEGLVAVLGNANLDPLKGEGRHSAIQDLLSHERLQDPAPVGFDGPNTVDWTEPTPGNLSVSYVLPDARLCVLGAGVMWPAPEDPLHADVVAASRHRLVWVDVE